MSSHMFKLNDDKTEFIILHPKSKSTQNYDVLPASVSIGDATVLPVEAARNLGATFDSVMCLEQ